MSQIDIHHIKGVIFDYGGTIDSGGEHWSEVIWRGYRNCGVACDKASFREAYVYGERELARTRHIEPHHTFANLLLIKMQIELQYLVGQGKFAPQDVDEKAKAIADYCYAQARQWVEKARPVLTEMAKRFPMVLVSNFYGNIQAVLSDFHLDGFFTKIIESAVVGVRKPDPEIFAMGCRALHLNPDQVLVVGDSLRKDIEPAEKLGCAVLWLKGKGWTDEEDAVLHPAIISSLDELLGFFAD